MIVGTPAHLWQISHTSDVDEDVNGITATQRLQEMYSNTENIDAQNCMAINANRKIIDDSFVPLIATGKTYIFHKARPAVAF